jgi:hypothetical protein
MSLTVYDQAAPRPFRFPGDGVADALHWVTKKMQARVSHEIHQNVAQEGIEARVGRDKGGRAGGSEPVAAILAWLSPSSCRDLVFLAR